MHNKELETLLKELFPGATLVNDSDVGKESYLIETTRVLSATHLWKILIDGNRTGGFALQVFGIFCTASIRELGWYYGLATFEDLRTMLGQLRAELEGIANNIHTDLGLRVC